MKNILNLFLAALLAVFPLAGKTQGVSLNVVGTQAEYQNNPIGIDYAPQLSWRIESPDRNVLQTAWRVLVASSPERLAADEGDIWDSGKVASAQSTCISTSHIPLTSRTRYYWKVKVWQDEAVSAWSEPAFFETGLLKASDWRGGWIGYVPGIAGRVLYFKASAHVGKPVAYARAYVAGIGYHSLYVNRKKVGDHVLDPAQSTYSKRVYYETYDIGPYLQEGGNSFVVPVAPGWLGTPRLRAQVEIVFTDGTFAVLNSDAFRHVIAGPTLYSTVFDGEAYDAREDSDDIWAFATPPGLMDDRWAWAHNTDDPVGELHAARVEPIRVVEELRPTLVGEPRPGVYVFDAGRNLAGWVALKVRGKAGDTIRLYFAETLRDDGSVNQDNLRNAKSTDAYTCAGTGEECWEPSFTYHGFRFFQVEGLPYKPADSDFTVKVVRTDVQTIGQFTCANDLVNRIHRMVVNTESSNLHSVPTDCPQRDERMGWLNDLTVSHEIAAYNFNMARFFPKFAQDITDTQDEAGTITCVAPFRFGMRPADPVCASYLLLPARAYEFYGNRQAIADQFDGMKAWTDYLASRTENGIVNYSYYGDWCPPRAFLLDPNGSGVSRDTPGTMISTGYLFLCQRLISKMAEVLGKDDVAAAYKTLAEGTRAAFHRTFWNEEKGGYASNNQASNAFALWLGIPEGKDAERALDNLVADVRAQDYHLTTGNLCTKYLLDVLADGGHVEEAWRIVTQETYPSWGYMLSKGATTVWERWEYLTGGAMNSHNHPMMGTVDAWFYRHLLGIAPDFAHPGFERFTLKPRLPEDLAWAEGSLETVKGTIRSSWRQEKGRLVWEVDVPANTTAEVHVPTRGGKGVSCNGKSVRTTPEGDYAVLSVGSGHYVFKSRVR